MTRTHAVFLRGITNVPMAPFREKLERLGLMDIASYGGTGNFVFSGVIHDIAGLESRIAEAVGVEAFVRTRQQLIDLVAHDPFSGQEGAAIFLARSALDARQRGVLGEIEFEGERPVVRGATVYFAHPTRRKGRNAIFDFERELGVRGTMRASRVVERVRRIM